jgi:hypothetical protein
MVLAVLVMLFIPFVALNDLSSIDRVMKFVSAVFTLDANAIIEADHSGSYRILPFYYLINNFDFFSLEGVMGRGNDYVSSYLYTVMRGTPEGHVAGGLAVTLTEYGFVSFLIFLIFAYRSSCRSYNVTDVVMILILFLFSNGLNNQVLWFGLIALATNKYFFKQNRVLLKS